MAMLQEIAGGPTDDSDRVSLIKWCAYYGDVSAIKFLLSKAESLESLGDNFDLNGACFHGHWRLCKFLIERGADVNRPLPDTGETPLHAALCTTQRLGYNLFVARLGLAPWASSTSPLMSRYAALTKVTTA
jgi:hypothetical protein